MPVPASAKLGRTSHSPSPSPRCVSVPVTRYAFNDMFNISRPPLPRGSKEFEALIAEFRPSPLTSTAPPPASRRRDTGRKTTATTSRGQQFASPPVTSSPFSPRSSKMTLTLRRPEPALSLTAMLSQKRLLRWLDQKRSGLTSSPRS